MNRTLQSWEALIRRAVSGSGVTSSFQPIVDLQRLTVVGYEALARFEHPDRSVTPDQWFNAANELNLAGELDAAVLRSTLARRADLPPGTYLALNLEPTSLLNPAVHDLLVREGDLAGLVIEITEHQRLDLREIESELAWIRSMGAIIAVDDAGAGHSGLQQILELKPSILKLDRSLVAGVDHDEAKGALIEMLGLFAKRIGAVLVAEGVEEVGEANRLIHLDVPFAQGYLFGAPKPAWTVIDRAVRESISVFVESPHETLHRLVDPVAALLSRDVASRSVDETALWWTPVVNDDRKPLGLMMPGSATVDSLSPIQRADVLSSPSDVAHRLSTAATEPGNPVVVTDAGGRYVGLLTLRRLLSHLATR